MLANRPRETKSFLTSKTVTKRCSVKKVVLEILQNSQKNTCVRASFSIKFQGSGLQLYLLRWLLLSLRLQVASNPAGY